jgi:hypothetical protein
MKHSAVWPFVMLLVFNATCWSQSYVVDFVYLDLSNPLPMEPGSQSYIRDGALCQIIEDYSHDGIAPPDADGSPGEGDRLLPLYDLKDPHGSKQIRYSNSFTVNGEELLEKSGCFFASPGICGHETPAPIIFLRIWNSVSPAASTGYWDTPLYAIASGYQQMNFSLRQMQFNTFSIENPNKSESEHSPNASAGENLLVHEFALHDAYPNPFNPTTTISYELAEAGMADVRVFDLTGRQVRQLVNEAQASGGHEIGFDARNLPSGMYLVSARLGSKFMTSKRIVLVK